MLHFSAHLVQYQDVSRYCTYEPISVRQDIYFQPMCMQACMTDVTALTVDMIKALNVETLKSIVQKNSSSEAQIHSLIAKEMKGRRRTCLLRYLAGKVRMFESRDGYSRQGGHAGAGSKYSSSKATYNGANKATTGVSGNINAMPVSPCAGAGGACAPQKSGLHADTLGKRKINGVHVHGCKRLKPSGTQMGCDSTPTPMSQLNKGPLIAGGASLARQVTTGKTDSKNTHVITQPVLATDPTKTIKSSDKDKKSLKQLRMLFSPTAKADALIGVCIKKNFGDYGVFEGKVISHDIDSDSGKVIFRVRYADGDEEDLFLDELRSLYAKGES